MAVRGRAPLASGAAGSPGALRRPEPEAGGPQSSISPRWPAAVGSAVCVLGLAVAGYLTCAHYTTAAALACPETGIVNCAKVTTSSYSEVLGIPVAVLGLAFFAGMLPMQLPLAWRSSSRRLRAARVAAATVGVGAVCWLLYAELFELDAICLYCTAVHALTVLLFVTTALGTVATSPLPDESS